MVQVGDQCFQLQLVAQETHLFGNTIGLKLLQEFYEQTVFSDVIVRLRRPRLFQILPETFADDLRGGAGGAHTVPFRDQSVFINQVQGVQRRILGHRHAGIGIFRGQDPACELLPVLQCSGTDADEVLHAEFSGIVEFRDVVARLQPPACVKINAEIKAAFLEPCEQIVELIELDRIDGQGVLGFPVKQIVLEVMETDCIITEPFRFFDKILGGLAIKVVGSADQIRAEKTDPLFRSVFKYQMPFPVRDNTSVFPGGHVGSQRGPASTTNACPLTGKRARPSASAAPAIIQTPFAPVNFNIRGVPFSGKPERYRPTAADGTFPCHATNALEKFTG